VQKNKESTEELITKCSKRRGNEWRRRARILVTNDTVDGKGVLRRFCRAGEPV